MPEPDDELASGPLWLGGTVEPWIDSVQARLDSEQEAERFGPALLRRAARRLLRFAALLLEDAPREPLLVRAYADLAHVADLVRGCPPTADRDRVADALDRVLGSDQDRPLADCLTAVAEVLPLLRPDDSIGHDRQAPAGRRRTTG